MASTGTSGVPPTAWVTPDDHSAYLIVVSVTLVVWMVMFWGLRLVIRTRFNGPWKADDSFCTAGTIAALVNVSLIYTAIKYGLGKKMALISDEHLLLLEKYLYVSQIFYVIAVSLSKISTSFLIARLTRARSHIVMAHILSGFIGAWTIVSVCVISIRCDLHGPWDLTGTECAADPFARWIAIETVFAFIEVLLFGLSVYLVWNLRMENHLKAIVIGAFVCRVFVIVTIAVRLYYLRPVYFLDDATFNSINAGILTQVCMHYSIMASTIPCTRPFMKAFHGYLDNEDLGVTSNSGWSNANKSRDTDGYMLHSVSSASEMGKSTGDRPGDRSSRPIITVDAVLASSNPRSSPTKEKVTPGGFSGPSTPHSPSSGFATQLDLAMTKSRSSHPPALQPQQATPPGASVMLRPDHGEVFTTVDHNPHLTNGSKKGDDSSTTSDDSARGATVIRQVRDWEVTYERTG